MQTSPKTQTLTRLTLTLTVAGLTLWGAIARADDEPRFDPAPTPSAASAPAQPAIIELQAVDGEQPLRPSRPGQVGRVSQVYVPAPMGAQPMQVQPGYGYVPCDGGMECMIDKHALKLALKADPAYSAATGKMVGGIVLTAVGGAAAVILGLASMLSSLDDAWCSDWDYDGGDHGCQKTDTTRNLGIAALVSLGVGLAVGLPVLISGASDRKEIRQRILQQQLASQAGFGLANGPGQAGLGVRYAF